MATWMVHFRIAENLLKKGLLASEKEFVVGNIGPDCGLPDKETGEFYPGKEVTHFKEGNKISPRLFLDQYMKQETFDFTDPRLSFYLGCYLHLVTDVEWSQLHQKKKKEPIYQEILGTPEYTRMIKRDWYGADFVYLKEHSDTIFENVFQHITSFPDYLDIFPANQISKQIKRITDFYNGNAYEMALDPDYRFDYLTPDEVSQFVNGTTEKLVHLLNATFGENVVWDKHNMFTQ